ncbi:MAG: AAA family ATPase [Chloroflexi bacterium]|nr:AAA family ATPase [Chloroflexota bacterium]
MDDYLGQFKSRKRQTQELISISPTGLISLAREQRLVIRTLLRSASPEGMRHGDLLAATELSEAELAAAIKALVDNGWVVIHQGPSERETRYRAVLRIVAKQAAGSRYWSVLMDDSGEGTGRGRSAMSTEMEENLRRFLPSNLFERLPAVDAMTEAVQHLNRLHRAISAFLPLYIAEGDILTTERYTALRNGTFIFADVSGFTAMSEYLARRGQGGAENLTLVMNAYFSEMLDILAKSDAQVLKFAGDALLAFFPARSETDLSDAHKAIRAGLRMQRAMIENFQPIHTPQLLDVLGREKEHVLSMTAGVARGALFEALVGNATQCELMVQGDLPGLAMQAEAVGSGNDVIVDGELAARIGVGFTLKPAADGFMQVLDTFGDSLDDYEVELPVRRRAKTGALFDLEPANLQEHIRVTLEKLNPAATYLAPAVLDQLILSGDYRVPADNRYAVSMFIHVTGFAEMLRAWGAEHLNSVCELVERYYTMVQPLIASRGGSLIRSDPYEFGVKILVIFGAPVAHTDDPLRAVDAALAMQRQLELLLARFSDELPEALRPALEIRHRFGIARGEVFAGEVGWRARREYTVMGDAVNLAARIMSKTPFGAIWVDERMFERVQYRFSLDPMQPLRLKGKTGQIQVYQVNGTRGAEFVRSQEDTTFVGRSLLLLTVSRALEQALNERTRRSFLLTGEVGSGKTRVARKIALTAQAMGYTVALVHPQPGASRSVLWASIISSLLYIPAEATPEEARSLAMVGLQALGLTDDVPALIRIIVEEGGLYAYDHTSTASGAMPRRELSPLILRFFRAYAERTPTLIVIDDVHQAGSDAHAIIRELLLSPDEMPLIIVGTGDPGLILDIPAEHFDVADLNEDETEQAAAALLGVAELGNRLKEVIWTGSGGRPLFIEAQLRALKDANMLLEAGCTVELKTDATTPPLPNELRDLVSARVDHLGQDEQAVLRAAAVLSEAFAEGISQDALNAVTQFDDDQRLAVAMEGLDLYGLLIWDERSAVRFRHGLVQQAVYASLTRAARLKLHRLAVDYWKQETDDPDQPFRVAYHLARSGLLPQAVETLTAAAETASSPERAMALYRKSLELLPDQKHVVNEIERLGGSGEAKASPSGVDGS